MSLPRICRIAQAFPTDQRPGHGLPEYHMTVHAPVPTLVIIGDRGGTVIEQPDHVTVRAIKYPDAWLTSYKGWHVIIPFSIKIVGYLWFLLRSIPAVASFRPDIVHLHTPLPILTGLFAKYFLGSRLVVQFHGTDALRVKQSRILRAVLRQCDCVMYVSRGMEETFESFLPASKLWYVGNGVDLDQFHPRPDVTRQDQVCMVGGLRWQKGYEYALEAFAAFAARHPTYRLAIAGEGVLQTALTEQAERLGIAHSVSFLGYLGRDEVARLFNQSRVFMLSSVSEGFPKVILESAACGTPVVATDVGSSSELVPPAGILVPSQDAQVLTDALCQLVEDSQKWQECSEAGIKIASEYGWDEVGRRAMEKYTELLHA